MCNTRTSHKYDLTTSQERLYATGISILNKLPPIIKSLNHKMKVFQTALNNYLVHSLYSGYIKIKSSNIVNIYDDDISVL
jgi:hypothetical protein